MKDDNKNNTPKKLSSVDDLIKQFEQSNSEISPNTKKINIESHRSPEEISKKQLAQNKENGKRQPEKNNQEAEALIKQLDQFVNEASTGTKKINIGSHRSLESSQRVEDLIKQLEQSNSEIFQETKKNNQPSTDKSTWKDIKETLNKFSKKSNSIGENISNKANTVKQRINEKSNSVGKDITDTANMVKQRINKKVNKSQGR